MIRVAQDAKHPTSIAKAMDIIFKDFGRPKLLVNKIAAIIQKGNVADLDIDVWDRAIKSYFSDSFMVSRSVMPVVQSDGGSAIVNIASTLATVPATKACAYFANHGELLQLFCAITSDHANDFARVRVILSEPIRTELLTT